MKINIRNTAALLRALRARVRPDSVWDTSIIRALDPSRPEAAHLAVMHEPYLAYVLAGRKTMESRFSKVRIAPFRQVAPRDVLLLKSLNGPITGIALLAEVHFYTLDAATRAFIRATFSRALCADSDFWTDRMSAYYATLMQVEASASISPLPLEKRDRRGWVVLSSRSTDTDASYPSRILKPPTQLNLLE